MIQRLRRTGSALAVLAVLAAVPAAAEDEAPYYHPPITSEETFTRNLIAGPPARKQDREGFVTLVTRAQLDAPANPTFSLFAKGTESDRLYMIALSDDEFRTLHRARAVLAQLTYNLRSTTFFQEQGLAVDATFFDMLQLLGFESLVVSDGMDWAHRIAFE
ncbi:MAG: hypothetical protein R6V44_06980 [Paracoccaceae bacterium]